jgi:hypothetical protein
VWSVLISGLSDSIPTYFNQAKAMVDSYAATRFVLDAKVSFEMRPGGVGVENGLRPTLCRSSESHLRQTQGGFSVAKGPEM